MASERSQVQKSMGTIDGAQKQKGGSAHAEPPELNRNLVRGSRSRLSLLRRTHADETSVPPLILKLHDAGDEREQRVVFALSDADSSLMLRAALSNQDRPRVHQLAAKPLYSKPLSV
jgi:hypothetical protein